MLGQLYDHDFQASDCKLMCMRCVSMQRIENFVGQYQGNSIHGNTSQLTITFRDSASPKLVSDTMLVKPSRQQVRFRQLNLPLPRWPNRQKSSKQQPAKRQLWFRTLFKTPQPFGTAHHYANTLHRVCCSQYFISPQPGQPPHLSP